MEVKPSTKRFSVTINGETFKTQKLLIEKVKSLETSWTTNNSVARHVPNTVAKSNMANGTVIASVRNAFSCVSCSIRDWITLTPVWRMVLPSGAAATATSTTESLSWASRTYNKTS